MDLPGPPFEAGKVIGQYTITEQFKDNTFRAVHNPTRLPVAILLIPKEKSADGSEKEDCSGRISIYSKMDHPFIIHYFESFAYLDYTIAIMEYPSQSTLLDYINRNTPLTEDQIRPFFCQIVSALDYLHNKVHICHRNLKAENILLDVNNNVRLIGFTLCAEFQENNPLLTQICGPVEYISPEIINGERYTTKADIWSLGILLYAMAVGKLPFEDKTPELTFRQIRSKDLEFPEKLSPDLLDLLTRILQRDPSKRISLEEIQEHPWFCALPYSGKMNRYFGEKECWKLNTSEISSISQRIRYISFITEQMQRVTDTQKHAFIGSEHRVGSLNFHPKVCQGFSSPIPRIRVMSPDARMHSQSVLNFEEENLERSVSP